MKPFLIYFSYFVFSLFSVCKTCEPKLSDEEGINIYLSTNGVHLDIIVPVYHPLKDWNEDLFISGVVKNHAEYLSFGWGDQAFYLNTPNWSDLKLSTAFQAAFLSGPSLLHVDYYSKIPSSDNTKKVQVSEDTYHKMVRYIENTFQRNEKGQVILIPEVSYHKYDQFYKANGSYHAFFTCNTWVNKCLRESELPHALWTPFDWGVLRNY